MRRRTASFEARCAARRTPQDDGVGAAVRLIASSDPSAEAPAAHRGPRSTLPETLSARCRRVTRMRRDSRHLSRRYRVSLPL